MPRKGWEEARKRLGGLRPRKGWKKPRSLEKARKGSEPRKVWESLESTEAQEGPKTRGPEKIGRGLRRAQKMTRRGPSLEKAGKRTRPRTSHTEDSQKMIGCPTKAQKRPEDQRCRAQPRGSARAAFKASSLEPPSSELSPEPPSGRRDRSRL